MPGFDWNGNGKTDAFDHYMNMKVTSDSSESSAHYTGTKHSSNSYNNVRPTQTSDPETEQAPRSSGETILRCILCIAILFGGIALAGAVGGLGGAFLMIGSVFVAYGVVK